MKNKNKTIGTILLTSSVWLLIMAGVNYLNAHTDITLNIGERNRKKVQTIAASKSINIGDVITKNDVEEKLLLPEVAVKESLKDKESVIGKVAQNNIYKNQQITQDDIIEKKVLKENLKPYAITVSLKNLCDDEINKNDFVDIKVRYNNGQKTDIVASKIKISKITDGSRNIIVPRNQKNIISENNTEQQIPAFAYSYCSDEEMAYIDDAAKKGELYLVKYPSANIEKSKVTYIPSWKKNK